MQGLHKLIPAITQEDIEKDALEAVQIAWDMLMLKPPAIACTPKKCTQSWHMEYGPQWNGRKPAEPMIYYRPLLLYGAGGSTATQALVGNKQPNSRHFFTSNAVFPSETKV